MRGIEATAREPTPSAESLEGGGAEAMDVDTVADEEIGIWGQSPVRWA